MNAENSEWPYVMFMFRRRKIMQCSNQEFVKDHSSFETFHYFMHMKCILVPLKHRSQSSISPMARAKGDVRENE